MADQRVSVAALRRSIASKLNPMLMGRAPASRACLVRATDLDALIAVAEAARSLVIDAGRMRGIMDQDLDALRAALAKLQWEEP